MRTALDFCTPGTSVREVIRTLLERDRGAMPVVERFDSRRPVGIVTGLAIIARLVEQNGATGRLRVRDVMEDPVLVSPDDRRAEVAKMLEAESTGYALVVDESGACVGVISKVALTTPGPLGGGSAS